MPQTEELTELKRIRELLEFQMLDPLQQRLDQVIGNNKDKKIIWVLSDGKTSFTEMLPKLSVKRASAYNYLAELKYHNLIKEHGNFPMRVVDFIPGKWGAIDRLMTMSNGQGESIEPVGEKDHNKSPEL